MGTRGGVVNCVLDARGNERRGGVRKWSSSGFFHLRACPILPKREKGKRGLVRVSEALEEGWKGPHGFSPPPSPPPPPHGTAGAEGGEGSDRSDDIWLIVDGQNVATLVIPSWAPDVGCDEPRRH